MQFAEGIRLALQQIWTEKLKSFFSLLGVIVGVMFLIVVVSIVEGLDRYIREDLASAVFGVHTVTLRRWSDGPNFGGSGARARQRRPRITYEDWEAVREQITVPARVGAESDTGGEIVADNGQSVENVRIHAVSPEIMAIRDGWSKRGARFLLRRRSVAPPSSCSARKPRTSCSKIWIPSAAVYASADSRIA